jgi:NAD(P)-dependent dehydrogenase (short-subunit alcohol dehydrogenase family)
MARKTPSRAARKQAPTAVVFGVGAPRGLGAALARRFAREGLRVVIAARNEERLARLAGELRREGADVDVAPADVTLEDDVARAIEVAASGGPLELVAYNVGSNVAQAFLNTSPASFESLWRQNALGALLVGQETVRNMLPRKRGTLLFTGATASLRARPPFTAFASAKAALRAVAQGLAREFGPSGLHVGHVIVDGVIDGAYAAEEFPELFKAKESDGRLAPDAIAEAFWMLHKQHPSAWTHELDLRPFKEPF